MIKIKKGHRYKCIKDVIIDGKFCYRNGDFYLADYDDCLTDINGKEVNFLSFENNEENFIECKESVKNDRLDGKLMWELLPLQDIEDIVKVYTAGAKKYGPDKWQDLPNGYKRYKAAMFRHLLEHEKGNEIDEETGCLHIAQVAWNAIALLHIVKREMSEKRMEEIIEQITKK